MSLFASVSFRVLACACLFAGGSGAVRAAGELDTSFGDLASGKMSFPIISTDPALTPGVPAWSYVAPFKILAMNDGRSLVLANAATPYDLPISAPFVITIVRIGANGQLDATYGSGGRAVIHVGEDYSWRGSDALLLPDESVAIIGTIDNPDGSSDMAVWKVTPNGMPANGFGSDGLRRLHRGGLPSDEGKTLAYLIPDLVIAGNVRDGLVGNHSLGAMLMNATTGLICSGSPVCGNVVGGDVGLPTEWRMLRIVSDLCPNGGDMDVADLTTLPAGIGVAVPIVLRGCGDTAVVKHTMIGNIGGTFAWGLNAGYANNSRSLISFGPGYKTVANAIVHAPIEGALGVESLVVAGYRANADGSQPVILAARLDRTSAHTATYDMQLPGVPVPSPGAYADSILVQPDGGLLLGGGYAVSSFTYGDAAIMRMTPNLAADASFGGLSASLPGRNGYGHFGNGNDRDNRVNSMALTSDGKLIFAGYMYDSDDGAARYGSVMRVILQSDRIFYNGFE